MKEIALLIHGENVVRIELPERFVTCRGNDRSGVTCPFLYEDEVMGDCCFLKERSIECPFVRSTKDVHEYLREKVGV